MKTDFLDRIVAALSYLTMGIFSIIWLIFVNITRRPVSNFLSFNLYQSIFLSVVLALISMLYSIALSFLGVVPLIKDIAVNFDLAINHTPVYFGSTLTGVIVSVIILYLILISLLGKKPYIPVISDIISLNFGG